MSSKLSRRTIGLCTLFHNQKFTENCVFSRVLRLKRSFIGSNMVSPFTQTFFTQKEIVSKRRAGFFFIISWSWNIFQISRILTIKKSQSHKYHEFHDFWLRKQIAWDWEDIVYCESSYFSLNLSLTNDGLTLWHYNKASRTSKSRANRSQGRKSWIL